MRKTELDECGRRHRPRASRRRRDLHSPTLAVNAICYGHNFAEKRTHARLCFL
jgi:hypothetical protein